MWSATHQKGKNYLFDIQSIGKECNMEMCYDGALVMPNNYAVVDEEEMTYVDGGVDASIKWWGVRLSLSEHETDVYCSTLNWCGGGTALAGVISGIPTAGTATLVLGIISAGFWFESGTVNLLDAIGHRNGVYIDINWAGKVSYAIK